MHFSVTQEEELFTAHSGAAGFPAGPVHSSYHTPQHWENEGEIRDLISEGNRNGKL